MFVCLCVFGKSVCKCVLGMYVSRGVSHVCICECVSVCGWVNVDVCFSGNVWVGA